MSTVTTEQGEVSIYKELDRNKTKSSTLEFGKRSKSVTKSTWGSKTRDTFTKDLGLNKYIKETLSKHKQMHDQLHVPEEVEEDL